MARLFVVVFVVQAGCTAWVVIEPPSVERVVLKRRVIKTGELTGTRRLNVRLEEPNTSRDSEGGTSATGQHIVLRVTRASYCRGRIEEAYRDDRIERLQKNPAHDSNPPERRGKRTQGLVQVRNVGPTEYLCNEAPIRHRRFRISVASVASSRPGIELTSDDSGRLLVDWRSLIVDNIERPLTLLVQGGEGAMTVRVPVPATR